VKPALDLPPELWPFRPVEIYAFVTGGARLVFHDPPDPLVSLRLEDVVQGKHELAAALKTIRNPRLRDDNRKRAASRISELRRELVRLHLWLRRQSIGYRPSPTAPVHAWP
jgi:hypothetical protein